jgi:glycosyltransferase involved in cell wall biosynthesis
MSVLFGHPAGNPNSLQAALAHYEAGWLEAFCVPWLPSARTIGLLRGAGPMAGRFARRRFAPLDAAPTVQGRLGEARRLALRALGLGDEGLSYQANDWLMRTMRRECRRPAVAAVHAYEDCSLWQFEEAKRRGQACIYDMPIGYHAAWREARAALLERFARWLPEGGLAESRYVRVDQKRREMELADLVLAPGSFVERTVRASFPDKAVARAPYGVDADFWCPGPERAAGPQIRFIHAGQISLRKGIPLLLEAWGRARPKDAVLELVGRWQLAEGMRRELPPGVEVVEPQSAAGLRERYRAADVFVFPSYFEGFGLVLLEAMACGLPAIASDSTAAPDVLDETCGRVIGTGDVDALVDAMAWFAAHRERLPEWRRAARERAAACTWERYRAAVRSAAAPYAGERLP